MDITTGTVIGGYTVRRRLGSGGMGTVYLARHPTLPRDVALKVLHPGLATTPAVRARFEREGELLSRLSHPNIVDVLDRGQQGDLLWMTMQYVPGDDVAALLEQHGPLAPERALAIVAAVGQALDHAHACGLLHRDVKPANILLAELPGGGERVMLTDFGIGLDMAASSVLTQTGEVFASFAYAAPEQLTGGRLDARTDIYALGAVLFELLTARRPFDAESLPALLYSVLQAPPPEAVRMRPELPPALDGVLRRAMAKDPAARFGSCTELVAAAQRCWPLRTPVPETWVGPVPLPPPPAGPSRPPGNPGGAHRRRLLIAVCLGLVVLLGGVVLLLAPWRADKGGGGAAASTTSRLADEPSPGGTGSWKEVQFIVDDFPSLLPATSDGQGWDGATCAPTAFAEDTHADVGITCQYSSGLTAEVAHYPDLAAREARRTELEDVDAADSPQPWRSGASTLAGVRLISEDNPNFVWQWIEFNQQDKSLYVVVLEWAGHTQAELDQEWFSRAPFAGPAGS